VGNSNLLLINYDLGTTTQIIVQEEVEEIKRLGFFLAMG
jgi:hypothetical protein